MTDVILISSIFENAEDTNSRLISEIQIVKSLFEKIPQIFNINSDESLVNYIDISNKQANYKIIIIATGGTENFAQQIIKKSNTPILMLANSQKNSLAAALEIKSYFASNKNLQLFYYENIEELEKKIQLFRKSMETIQAINKAKVGIIGKPSDWLLTSQNISSFGQFTTEMIKIDIEEVNKNFQLVDYSSSTESIKDKFKEINVSDKDLENSERVFEVINRMVSDYKLDALTIRCFDLLKFKYTACMALSRLNDDKITAGCEGDLFALFTMMVAQQLSGKETWMANPASINKNENTLVLAHCTIPTNMLANFDETNLSTHMESDLSTAIQGPLKKSDITVLRFGGYFNKLLYSTGKIVETNMKDPNLCRTQVKIKLDMDISCWIDNSLGNHNILVYGDISDLLQEFCRCSDINIM